MNIKDVMSKPVISLDRKRNIEELSRLMDAERISCVLVTKKDKKHKPIDDLGVVTESDIIRRVVSKGISPKTTLLEDVMTTPIIHVPLDTPSHEVNNLMKKANIRRVFISKANKVIGVITQRDLLKNIRYDTAKRLVHMD